VHAGDEHLLEATHLERDLGDAVLAPERGRDAAVAAERRLLEIEPGAEGASGAAQHHDPHGRIGGQ
jgi:hypothetical protein